MKYVGGSVVLMALLALATLTAAADDPVWPTAKINTTGGSCSPIRLDVLLGGLQGPSDLTCFDDGSGVHLAWTNNHTYDNVEVYCNGVLEAILDGTATSFTTVPDTGYHCFHVCGVVGTDVQCSEDCCLIYGYDNVELLWDFDDDDGGFVVDGTDGWEWGDPSFGSCAGTADGNVWATNLDDVYINETCWVLDSAPIDMFGEGGFICIEHCYDTESRWDGGVLWFTTNDSWYHALDPIGGADGWLSMEYGCQWVLERDAFSGDSGGWATDCWDLSDQIWADEMVKIRFAFGSDSAVSGYPGWMIDNITVFNNWPHPLQFCDYTVTPLTGTVPFQSMHRVTLYNNLSGGTAWTRRLAGRIAVTIGNGSYYNPWRAGYTNVAPGSNYFTQFPVNIPALATVIGTNTFTLSAMDVTPAPYNQPPYLPSGSTCTRTRTVVTNAP